MSQVCCGESMSGAGGDEVGASSPPSRRHVLQVLPMASLSECGGGGEGLCSLQ